MQSKSRRGDRFEDPSKFNIISARPVFQVRNLVPESECLNIPIIVCVKELTMRLSELFEFCFHMGYSFLVVI